MRIFSRHSSISIQIHRDPRFSALSGELSLHNFQTQYSFLADLHENELSTLKENLKRAKKLLRSSPRDLLEAREEEVQRLEAAVKRAESSVNRDRQEQVTQTAMEKLRKEEQEKQKQGKSGWWLKDCAYEFNPVPSVAHFLRSSRKEGSRPQSSS